MLDILKGLYDTARDPVLIADDNDILYRNPAALRLDQKLTLPDDTFNKPAPFTGGITLQETQYQVTVSAAGDYKVFVLYRLENNHKALLTALGTSLKDSISTIQLAASVLKNTNDGTNPQHYQNILSHHIHSLNRLAGNMLHLGSSDSHNDSSIVDLVELYDDLVHSVNVLTNGNKAMIEFTSDVNELNIKGNSTLLEKMLLNLLSNSLKATAIDGKITVSLACLGKNAVITVKDNGTGISNDILSNLFTSYETEKSFSESYQSVGMGLAVVHSIAQSMGGSVMVRSGKKGTSVTISLPISDITNDMLCTPSPKYGNKEISLLQTELCDVLTADCYGDVFSD